MKHAPKKLTHEQAQERYLTDVRWAIHMTKAGRWHLLERLTGESVGEYDSEPEARAAARKIDPLGMARINQEKIVGGPTYDELLNLGLDAARDFQRLHPGHLGSMAAIGQLEQDAKRPKLSRSEHVVVDPDYYKRGKIKGRCPTTKALR